MSSAKDPFDLLKKLVSLFEENEKELTDVPEEAVNYFGYSCLANSLMFKRPKIPNYDKDNISKYINTHNFATIDSLCEYIKSIEEDINKLFAIFCWGSLNIRYDADSYFSGNHQSATLEKVFETKLAVCDGYALFFSEMAKRVNINTNLIKIKNYSNFAKGYGYDPLNPPPLLKSDHASVYIEIDGVPFICDPTWGAGSLDDEKKFCSEFNPNYFLIPIYDTLSDHYPCDKSSKLLPINFPYEDYKKSIRIRLENRNIKTESNPFIKIKCEDGYLEQIYSYDNNFNSVSFNMSIQKEDNFEKIPEEGIIGFEVIQKQLPKHPKRCRFRVNIAFPQKGLYNIEMYINTHYVLEYYVDSLSKSSKSIPINYNPFRKEKFISIFPKTVLTYVDSNYTIIRFAVSKENAPLLCDIYKLNNSNCFNSDGDIIDKKNYSYITYEIPNDNERYEDQICVNFPTNGRYSVEVYLRNNEESFTHYVTYYFDVKGDIKNCQKKSIFDFIYNGRTFADKKFFDKNNHEIIMRPSASCNLITENEQFVEIKTESMDDKIKFNLNKDGETLFPKFQNFTSDQFRRYKLSFSKGFGDYNLLGWINDFNAIDVMYVYQESFQNPPHEENQIMNELRMKICGNNEASSNNEIERRQNEKLNNKINQLEEEKKQLEIRHRRSEEEKKQLEKKYQKSEEEKKQLENRYQKSEEEKKQIEIKYQKSEEEKKQLENRYQRSEEEKKQLENRYQKSEEEKKQLENRYQKSEEEKNQLENRYQKSEEEKKQLEIRHRRSEEEKKQLEIRHRKLEEEKNELERRIHKLEEESEEVKQLKKYISALKEKTNEIQFVKLDDYEEEGTLGKNRTSSVKIVHKKEQTKYIKKELTEVTYDTIIQFVHEGDILIKLRHPCIIEIIGINFGTKNISPSLFLPFEQESLETAIENDELIEHQKNKIIVELVLGMRFIHKQNFIHRSLKPTNILLDVNKHVRISDFGLAKEENFETTRKKGFSALRFLAPELFEDNEYSDEDEDKSKSKDKDKKSEEDEEEKKLVTYTNKIDVYSFGITLIFIITGKLPKFSIKKIMNGIIPSIPETIVEWVREMITSCLSFSPKNRPSFTEIYEIMKENNYDFFNEKPSTKLNKKQRANIKDIETRILEIEAFEYQHRND